MSKEIREHIDRVKNWKQYLIENIDDNIWYHASSNKFDLFNITNDIGYHFGTKEQAIDRMKQQKIKQYFLYKVKLVINKPLRTIDKKTWFGTNLLDILSVNKLVNRKEMLDKLDNLKKLYKYDENGKIIPNWSEKALREWNDELKQILYSSGYDSIIYQNKFENKATPEDSIVVFNKEQVKIIDVVEIDLKVEGNLEYESYRLKNKLKNTLLYFGGDDVELGLDTDEELGRMLNDGVLFDVDVVNLKGGFGLCHRNVADKYKRFNSGGFKIVTGYALSNGIWFQHSWGLGSTGKIMETTGNKYDMYYGYVLNEEESDEFCFSNY